MESQQKQTRVYRKTHLYIYFVCNHFAYVHFGERKKNPHKTKPHKPPKGN